MAKKQLIIVDPALRNQGGHHYNYAVSLRAAAVGEGITVTVLSHAAIEPALSVSLGAVPFFSEPRPGGTSRFPLLTRPMKFVWRCVRRTRSLLRSRRFFVSRRVTIFVANCQVHDAIAALIATVIWSIGNGPKPTVVLLIRFSLRRANRELRPIGQLLKGVLRLAALLRQGDTIHLLSDSSILAAEYSQLSALPMRVAPIPHVGQFATTAQCHTEGFWVSRNGIRMLALGGCRTEHGTILLTDAFRLLHRELKSGRLCLVAQGVPHAPNEEGLRAAEYLRSAGLPNTMIVESFLAKDEYYSLLSGADVVLLPYLRDQFIARTSGILIEALAAGKPVIVTEGTWLAEQISTGGGLTFKDGDAEGLARAILTAADRLPTLVNEAAAARERVLAFHDAKRLVDIVMSDN